MKKNSTITDWFRRNCKGLIVTLGISILLSAILYMQYRPKVIDADYPGVVLNTFQDLDYGGDSRILSSGIDSTNFFVQYRTGDTINYPYVGGGLEIADTNHFIDLQGFEYISLSLNPWQSTISAYFLNFIFPVFQAWMTG